MEDVKLRLQSNNKVKTVNARARNVSSGTVLKKVWVGVHGRLPNDVVCRFCSEVEKLDGFGGVSCILHVEAWQEQCHKGLWHTT